jgi:thiol-disulfide isomerase/thioredoxin
LNLKRYDEALPYIKEAVFTVKESNSVDYNKLYALIAEKTLPANIYVPQLENFVKEGKDGDDVISVLKNAYLAKGNNEKKFDTYLAQLKNVAYIQMEKEVKAKLINKPSGTFTLNDANGNAVNLDKYKGKIIILDFWATWCAPCIASFPIMNDLIQQYKTDTSVVFLFINTMESGADKITPAKDLILKKRYNWTILFDTDNKVSDLYNIISLPTKLIIGKDGKIRIKSVGFLGDEILKKELPVMIELLR